MTEEWRGRHSWYRPTGEVGPPVLYPQMHPRCDTCNKFIFGVDKCKGHVND